MRRLAIIFMLACVGGCATSAHKQMAERPLPQYAPAAASALAFDPPVIAGQPVVDTSREGRATEAFAGYESLTETFFYLRTDDDQRDFFGNRDDLYERRAISTKIGVSYR
ncbi:MAG TPA: hypothetical protein VHD56_14540 [Tepidisphaeraceae bacterium]|nr:hypothetical protein [Tepidisphaeraceae bacterium]